MLLAAGLVFLITGISRHRKYGDDPESDERSKKIGAYGLSYAWLTGLFFMFGLFWLDYLGVLRLSDTECTRCFHSRPRTFRGDLSDVSLPERGC